MAVPENPITREEQYLEAIAEALDSGGGGGSGDGVMVVRMTKENAIQSSHDLFLADKSIDEIATVVRSGHDVVLLREHENNPDVFGLFQVGWVYDYQSLYSAYATSVDYASINSNSSDVLESLRFNAFIYDRGDNGVSAGAKAGKLWRYAHGLILPGDRQIPEPTEDTKEGDAVIATSVGDGDVRTAWGTPNVYSFFEMDETTAAELTTLINQVRALAKQSGGVASVCVPFVDGGSVVIGIFFNLISAHKTTLLRFVDSSDPSDDKVFILFPTDVFSGNSVTFVGHTIVEDVSSVEYYTIELSIGPSTAIVKVTYNSVPITSV